MHVVNQWALTKERRNVELQRTRYVLSKLLIWTLNSGHESTGDLKVIVCLCSHKYPNHEGAVGNVPWARNIRTGSSSHGLYMLYFTRYFDPVTHIDQRGKFVHSGSQCPNVYVLGVYQDQTLSTEVILRQTFG